MCGTDFQTQDHYNYISELNTHTPYVCGFAWSDMVHGCMVYTELAPRRLQFHVAPAMTAL